MLIGNLTRDPEMRYTPTGTAVTTFGVATNRSWKTDAGEIRDEVEFHRAVAWNKLAELCSQLLTKGRKVYLEGRLQTRTFTGSDNAQHTITEIVIDDMILLDSRRPEIVQSGEGMPVGQPVAPVAASPAPSVSDSASDDSGKKSKKKAESKEEKPSPAKATDSTKITADKSAGREEAKPAMDENVNVDDIPF